MNTLIKNKKEFFIIIGSVAMALAMINLVSFFGQSATDENVILNFIYAGVILTSAIMLLVSGIKDKYEPTVFISEILLASSIIVRYLSPLISSATYSTADTVRPALQLIKTKPGNNLVSSCFILVRPSATGDNEVLAMGDCAININPTEDDLVEIAGETAKCARIFDVDPKIAFLSYSTHGSGKGEAVDKMRNAAQKTKEKYPDLPIDGELQFDAAVSPRVARTKCPESTVAGHANTFIFPDISAGNIGYKIAQRMGNFDAYGPILLGLNAPVNDLSRGCNASEVYSMAIITAALADSDHGEEA